VAGASFLRDCRIDALSIVPDAQLEQTCVIRDLRFDIVRLCVAESISHGLTRNRVDLVPQDWMQVAWTLHHHMELCGVMGSTLGGQFVAHFITQGCHRRRQFLGDLWRRT